MSGLDEQDKDATPCGCEKHRYWTIFEGSIRSARYLLGYLNPDSWIYGGYRKAINRLNPSNRESKDDFVSKIGTFYCEFCEREVKKENELFERLCSDVRRRWDMGHVRD